MNSIDFPDCGAVTILATSTFSSHIFMHKLCLLALLIATLAFLISLWAVPAVLVAAAFGAITTVWIRVVLCVAATLWLLLLRPWTMFGDSRFGRFTRDVRRAFQILIS